MALLIYFLVSSSDPDIDLTSFQLLKYTDMWAPPINLDLMTYQHKTLDGWLIGIYTDNIHNPFRIIHIKRRVYVICDLYNFDIVRA